MSEESKPPTLETDTSMLKEMLERLKQEESKKHELSHPASTSLLPDQFFLELSSLAGSSHQPSQQEDGKKHELSHPASTSFLEYQCNVPSSFHIGSTLSNKEMSGVILPMDLVKKKDRMLADHALLLKTLEELTEEQMETFQFYLTSPQQYYCLPIKRSQLKNTDRLNTVDQMVQYWGLLRAVRTTVRILKEINKHDLAVKLERDHTVSHPSSSAFYRDFKNQANRYQPSTRALHHKRFSEFSRAGSSHQPSQWDQCLHVPALLLKTLEELSEEQMETFQSYLTSPQQSNCPSIPKSQLKNTDRLNTVDQMVNYWGPLRAVRITVRTLKEINKHDLAVKLKRDHTVSNRELAFRELFTRAGSSHQPSQQEESKKHKLSHPASTSHLPDQFHEPSCYSSGGTTLSDEELSSVPLPLEPGIKMDQMLRVPALLLKTLEELTEEHLKTFQSNLTSPQRSDLPPIPKFILEIADIRLTVGQMVWRYGPERAIEITVKILRKMDQNELAKKLDCSQLMDSSSGIVSKETLDEDDRRRVKGKNRKQSNFMAPRGVLATLEELTEEQMETFQSILTSPLWYNYPPIPRSLLKNTDRQNTVGLMMWRYGPQRAVEITLKILRTIKRHDLAVKLEGKKRKRRKKPSLPDPGSVKKRDEDCVSLTDSSSSILSDESSDRGDTEIQKDRDELDTKSISSVVKRSSYEDIQGASQQQEATSDAQAVDVQESGLRLDFKEEVADSAFDSPLFLKHPDMMTKDEFTPEIHNPENGREYRFHGLRAGLFQCSITGLVFGMEGEGDVVYRTVPWDRKLLAQSGKRPAGPLFNIYCPQMSVSQLHLPHCEIPSEGGSDFLFVAHVTDGCTEFILPHQTTETHVILNITGFSKYGVTKVKNAPITPIRAVVLLFYQLPDVNNKSMLNMLLLPRNVDIDEVCEKRRRRTGDGEKYIEVNPNCLLTPDEDYTLSTDLSDEQHRIEPAEKATFVDYDSYTNYMPTFQLWLNTVFEEVDLILKEHDGPEIWKRSVPLPAPPINVPSTASTTENTSTAPPLTSPNPTSQAFITKHRTALETRLGLLRPILLRLQDRGVLIDEEREVVISKSTKTLQNQALLDMVVRKGDEAQEEFYQVLREADPFLIRDLEKNKA